MPEYPPGMPSWVELGGPDPGGSAGFYSGLFGWERQDASGHPVLALDGQAVAGLGLPWPDDRPAAWTVCVAVADASETAARAVAAGGAVLAGPADAGEAGRAVVVADPAGAVIAGWEPGALRGAGLLNRPRSFCWCELATRDTEEAARFYRAVFDWHAAIDEELRYTEWKLVDRTIAGMLPMTPDWPPEVPAHWLVYFAVEDCDRSAAKAEELGAAVRAAPADISSGRAAVVEDAQGALFGIVALRAVGAGTL